MCFYLHFTQCPNIFGIGVVYKFNGFLLIIRKKNFVICPVSPQFTFTLWFPYLLYYFIIQLLYHSRQKYKKINIHLPTGSMGIAGFTHELQTMSKESGRRPVCRFPFLRAKHNRRFSASKTASLLEIFVWELPQWEACRKQHTGTICLF